MASSVSDGVHLQCAAGLRPATFAQRNGVAQAAQPRQRRRRSVAAAAKQRQNSGRKGFGQAAPAKAPPASNQGQQKQEQQDQQAAAAASVGSSGGQPAAAAGPGSSSGSGAVLPAVDRGVIFAVGAQVSLIVTALGFGLRAIAPSISPAVADGQAERVEALLQWASVPSAGQLALAAAVAGGVTVARVALLSVWPEFKQASDRSNQQVLAPLGAADLLWVAALPAVSEELLFRGALIPAVYPDWRGVLIAGLVFGVLHNSGGRNPAFAAWASSVGCAYGALFLATGSVACPALAHTLANVASGALWRAANAGGGGGSMGGGGGAA